jgi:hypothetical protein
MSGTRLTTISSRNPASSTARVAVAPATETSFPPASSWARAMAPSTVASKWIGTPPRGQSSGGSWVSTTIGTSPPVWPFQPFVMS